MRKLSNTKSAIKRREQRANETPLERAIRLLKRKESEARTKAIIQRQFNAKGK